MCNPTITSSISAALNFENQKIVFKLPDGMEEFAYCLELNENLEDSYFSNLHVGVLSPPAA